jgi:phage terminase large subunit-like protein
VFLVTLLFGWRLRADLSRRRFSVLYLEVGRKAAKSTLMACLALFHLAREAEPGASVICGATTGQQARVVFSIMQRMVRRSAWLRGQGLQVFANAIVFEASSARPVNSRATHLDGLNPSCIVLDESHAQTFELHDVLRSAQGARGNPLLLCPTTAGFDVLSVGYALRTQLTKVLEGVFEADHLAGAIFTLDEGDDWRDERVWSKACPMLGTTPKLDWVRKYASDAQQAPGLEGEFKTKVCNIWMQSASSWLSMTAWDACADPALRLEQFAGELACIGADLAQKDDLAALAIVFKRDAVLYGFVNFYLPRLVVEERSRAVPAYRLWADAGVLTLTEGNTLDETVIEADVRQWCERFDVRAIGFDQFGSAGITNRLFNDGLPATVVPKNTKTFSEPARDLEVRVRQRLFRHDGNGILRWNASNCCVTRRVDDSLLPKKDHPDSANKIDGVDALLLAMGAFTRTVAADEGSGSVYDSPTWQLTVF